MLTGKATAQSLCAHVPVGNWTQEPVISIWTDVHNMYMVTVQYIYSFLVYLTFIKAYILTGLPAATLNEELDPAYVSGDVFARVCVCVCLECACV